MAKTAVGQADSNSHFKRGNLMDHRDRWNLDGAYFQFKGIDRVITRMRRILKGSRESEMQYAQLLQAIDEYAPAFERVKHEFTELLDSDVPPRNSRLFSACEQSQLIELNRSLSEIFCFVHERANIVRPEMLAKLADPEDPMVDFEIEARIDYVLREDDSAWSDEVDNYLSTRTESLTHKQDLVQVDGDWSDSATPDFLQKEPLSQLLHELTDHSIGFDGPRVSMEDCLRLGSVFVDIHVQGQYEFDLSEGKWIKR